MLAERRRLSHPPARPVVEGQFSRLKDQQLQGMQDLAVDMQEFVRGLVQEMMKVRRRGLIFLTARGAVFPHQRSSTIQTVFVNSIFVHGQWRAIITASG